MSKHRVYSDMRNKLYQAAFKLSLKKGLHQWTLKDLAKEVDIAVGQLFYYVKKKEELINQVVKEVHVADPMTLNYLIEDGASIHYLRLYLECEIYVKEGCQTGG